MRTRPAVSHTTVSATPFRAQRDPRLARSTTRVHNQGCSGRPPERFRDVSARRGADGSAAAPAQRRLGHPIPRFARPRFPPRSRCGAACWCRPRSRYPGERAFPGVSSAGSRQDLGMAPPSYRRSWLRLSPISGVPVCRSTRSPRRMPVVLGSTPSTRRHRRGVSSGSASHPTSGRCTWARPKARWLPVISRGISACVARGAVTDGKFDATAVAGCPAGV